MHIKLRFWMSLLSGCILAGTAFCQNAGAALRKVEGQTIISLELPRVRLTLGKELLYIGGRRVNLYGNADAEPHLFAKTGEKGQVERFAWIQFEHFFPSNSYTYHYPAEHRINLGGLDFVYDCKCWDDFAAQTVEDSASDGAAIGRLLAKHDLKFPARVARVRMFHLPTSDRRSELMIIYGEAIPPDSRIPLDRNGIILDKDAPDAARRLLEDARWNLTVTTP